MKSNKGTLLDFIYLGIMLFAFSILIVVLYPVLVEVNKNMNESGIGAEQLQISKDIENKFVGITDAIFLFILVGLSIAVLIGALLINTHPAFYFITVGLLVFFAVINAIFGNVFSEVIASPLIADYADQFVITVFVMQHFPFVIFVISMVIAIILFSKGGGL